MAKLKETPFQSYAKKLSAAMFITFTALHALYLTDDVYVMLTTHKANFFYLFAYGITALCILSYFSLSLVTGQRLKLPKLKSLTLCDWAFISYILLSLISALLSDYQAYVWKGLPERSDGFFTTLGYCLIYFVIAKCYSPRRWHTAVFALSALLVSVIAALQYYGVEAFFLYPYPLSSFLLPFRTTLGNIDIVAAYCALTVLFFAVMYIKSTDRLRFLYLAACLASFLLLLIGDADAGKVGILGCMVLLIPYFVKDKLALGRLFIVLSGFSGVFAAFRTSINLLAPLYTDPADNVYYYFLANANFNTLPFVILCVVLLCAGLSLILLKISRWPGGRTTSIAAAVLIALILVGGLTGIEVIGKNPDTGILYEAREIMHGNWDDRFGSARIAIWKLALPEAANKPLLGTGPDTFPYAIGEAKSEQFFAFTGVSADKAHNEYLQILLTLGLPALLSYLLLLASLLSTNLKRAFENPFTLAALAAALSYAIQAFFSISVPIVTPIFIVMLGVLGAAKSEA